MLTKRYMLVLTLVIAFLIGGHLMDIGDVIGDYDNIIKRLIDENSLPYKHIGGAGNGFFRIDSSKVYHIDFYMMYVSFFGLVILILKQDEGG